MDAVTRLDNGILVATASLPHAASVSIGLWIATGGRYEPATLNGVAHFIEHMLFKGTQRRSALQISQDVEGLGGYLNAFTSEDHTCFYSKALHRHYDDLLDVLFDMLLNSRFFPADIGREREVIREEVAMYLDQPQQLVQELFNETMWPHHPLGRPLTGTFASLERLRRTDLVSFLHSHYTPGSTVVAAAGALEHQQIVDAVRQRTQHLPVAPRRSCLPYSLHRTRPDIRLVTRKTEQSQIALGFRGCSRRDPDRYAVRLLNILLGENMSSRLFQIIREERGLVYSIYTTPSFWDDVGDFVIYAGLDDAKIVPVLRLIWRELRRLARVGVTPGELARARDYALGQMDLSLENTEHHMMWIGEQLSTTGHWQPLNHTRDALAAVTPAQIRAVAERFFQPHQQVLALVSSARSVRPFESALRTA